MALIVSGNVNEAAYIEPPEGASKFYLVLYRDYYDKYDMSLYDKFLGKILSAGESQYHEIKELEGEDISFVLSPVMERIYISKNVYNRTFREYGLVKEGFWLKAELNKAVIGGEEVEVYSKRDVESSYQGWDMRREILDEASKERDSAHRLHQEYLRTKEKDPSEAGEYLWGALNNLLSAFHSIQTGKGIGKHKDVASFAREILESQEGLKPEDFGRIENLHFNYYHDFLSEDDYRISVDVATKLYDFLDQKVGMFLSEAR